MATSGPDAPRSSLQESLRRVLAATTDANMEEAVMLWMHNQLRYYLDLQMRALREEWNRTDRPAGKAW